MAQYFAGGTKPVFDINRKFGKKTKTKGNTNTIKKGSKINFDDAESVAKKKGAPQNLSSNKPITETEDVANTVTTEETVTFSDLEKAKIVVDVIDVVDQTSESFTNTNDDNDPVIGLALKSVGPRSKKDDIIEYAKSLGIDLNGDVLTKKEMLAIINERNQ